MFNDRVRVTEMLQFGKIIFGGGGVRGGYFCDFKGLM